jgi:hypothetical protein
MFETDFVAQFEVDSRLSLESFDIVSGATAN